MTDPFHRKVELLRQRLRETESAVVAFSGGVDSALLVALTFEELGSQMIAATGISPSLPSRDREEAKTFCEERGIPFKEIATNEFSNPNYISNPSNRCYFCKHELFECLSRFATEEGFQYILEGTNADDLAGHRPGFQATQENVRVVAPLAETGFTKTEIRMLAATMKLGKVAEKPNTACLASRIPTGIAIDQEILAKIDRAEDRLRQLGLKQVRVRHHGDTARLEVGIGELSHVLASREIIQETLKVFGWNLLDIKHYGS